MESAPSEKPPAATGPWADHHQAYSSVAGSLAASKVESMKKARAGAQRDGISWQTHCPKIFGVSQSHADRLIHALDQHGPAFFQLSEIGGVGIHAFRRLGLAKRLDGNSILIEGRPVEIAPENSVEIRAAIDAVRREHRRSKPPKPAPPAAAKPETPQPVHAITTSEVEGRAVQATLDRFYDAARKGNTEACRAEFAPGGRYIGWHIHSDAHAQDFKPKGFDLSGPRAEIFFTPGEHVAWVSQLLGDPRENIYRAVGVLLRIENTWRIAQLHISKAIGNPWD